MLGGGSVAVAVRLPITLVKARRLTNRSDFSYWLTSYLVIVNELIALPD
jgi:hypothetical protein